MLSACGSSIPRSFLRDILADEPSSDLPLSVRCEMEGRFGASFKNVRLFRGRGANVICATINARACMIDGDILFRAGEWRPDEPSGARLIAHELTHVLQQRGTRSRRGDPLAYVGQADDGLEVEAERIADEVMRGSRRSPITRDETGFLRRVFIFDPASATIVVDTTNSTPGVAVSPARKLCYMHLTRGANEFIFPHSGVTAASASAINLEGRVDGIYDNIDKDQIGDLSDWRFRMRQITRINEVSAIYADPANDAGALEFEMALPPLCPATVSLSYTSDAVKSACPFMNDNRERFLAMVSGKTRIANDMDDHPKWGIPLAKINHDSQRPNLLFEAVRDQEFVSAFVAIDRNGRATTLANVAWRAYWKIRCKWIGLTCIPRLISSKFEVDKPERGAPDEPDLAALLTDLTPDYSKTANAWTESANAAVDRSDLGVRFMKNWPDSVPDDFFQQ